MCNTLVRTTWQLNNLMRWTQGSLLQSLHIFTDSALWAGSVIELPCPSVCLSVCANAKHPILEVEKSSGRREYPLFWLKMTQLSKKWCFYDFFSFNFLWVFWWTRAHLYYNGGMHCTARSQVIYWQVTCDPPPYVRLSVRMYVRPCVRPYVPNPKINRKIK